MISYLEFAEASPDKLDRIGRLLLLAYKLFDALNKFALTYIMFSAIVLSLGLFYIPSADYLIVWAILINALWAGGGIIGATLFEILLIAHVSQMNHSAGAQ